MYDLVGNAAVKKGAELREPARTHDDQVGAVAESSPGDLLARTSSRRPHTSTCMDAALAEPRDYLLHEMRGYRELQVTVARSKQMQHQDMRLQLCHGGCDTDEFAEVFVPGNGEENAPGPAAGPASGPDEKDWARGQFHHLVADAAEEQATKIGAAPGAQHDEISSVLYRRGSDLTADRPTLIGTDLRPSVDGEGDEGFGDAGRQRQTLLGPVAGVHIHDDDLSLAADGKTGDRQQSGTRGCGAVRGK